MNPRLAILCSGQGGQHAGMFDLIRSDPASYLFLQSALASVLQERSLQSLVDDDAALFSNQVAQPLIVAAGLASWLMIKNQIPSPTLVAGYSIGELTAYGIAGALPAIELVGIASQRATLMDDCRHHGRPQVMIAMSGMPIVDITSLAHSYRLHVAIETGEDSAIVGGEIADPSEFDMAISSRGGRSNILPVRIASHTPLMTAAVEPFSHLLNVANFGPFDVPVLAGISARPIAKKADAVDTLSRQLVEKIRWRDCMDAMAESGITVALELGPGSALARMMQSRHPQIACRSVADFRSIAGVTRWVASRMER